MRVAESCGDLDTFYAEQCWEGTWDRMTSEAWSWSADCIWYLTPQTRTIISCELSPPTDSVQQQSTKSQLYILPPFQFEGNAPLQLVSAGWWSLAEIQHGQGHQLVITALQASSHGNMSRAPLKYFLHIVNDFTTAHGDTEKTDPDQSLSHTGAGSKMSNIFSCSLSLGEALEVSICWIFLLKCSKNNFQKGRISLKCLVKLSFVKN